MESPLDAHSLVERYKADVTADITASPIKETLGGVLGYAPSGSRQALLDADLRQAQQAYKTQQYDVALDRFCHHLALIETNPSTTMVSETRATALANIAACLHLLGQPHAAKEHYERAVAQFKAVPASLLGRIWIPGLLPGDLNPARIAYVEARLEDIKQDRVPDAGLYVDGSGYERRWSQEEMEGKQVEWSWYSPRSWFGYGPLV